MTTLNARLGGLLVGLALTVPGFVAPPRAAAVSFPPGYAAYHTYPEMVAEVKRVAAAHPDIVKLASIGKSYQGRDIWVAKVSDNAHVDEAEPEVMFDGLHHAREHLSLEMTLTIFHWLVDGYRRDATATRLVDTRETWIIFAVNPDGAEYDLTGKGGSPFRGWRKNRQPNPGSSYVGTDLNRNYGYHFGCCGGSSGKILEHRVPRRGRLVGPRGPRGPRLRELAGGRRPPADPGGDHVPHAGPAGALAVRLHEDRRPGRHDGR